VALITSENFLHRWDKEDCEPPQNMCWEKGRLHSEMIHCICHRMLHMK